MEDKISLASSFRDVCIGYAYAFPTGTMSPGGLAAFACALQIFFNACPTPFVFFTGHEPATAGNEIQGNNIPVLYFFLLYNVHKKGVREAGEVSFSQDLP